MACCEWSHAHFDRETTRNRPWIDHSTALELMQSCRGRVEQFLNFVDSRETLRMRLAAGATAEELYVGFDSVIARWFKEKQLHNVSRNLDPVTLGPSMRCTAPG